MICAAYIDYAVARELQFWKCDVEACMFFSEIPFIILLAILLAAGVALIVDAIRRGIRDRQE
jgi:hypothetical protein